MVEPLEVYVLFNSLFQSVTNSIAYL
jgi:hypothetical protein